MQNDKLEGGFGMRRWLCLIFAALLLTGCGLRDAEVEKRPSEADTETAPSNDESAHGDTPPIEESSELPDEPLSAEVYTADLNGDGTDEEYTVHLMGRGTNLHAEQLTVTENGTDIPVRDPAAFIAEHFAFTADADAYRITFGATTADIPKNGLDTSAEHLYSSPAVGAVVRYTIENNTLTSTVSLNSGPAETCANFHITYQYYAGELLPENIRLETVKSGETTDFGLAVPAFDPGYFAEKLPDAELCFTHQIFASRTYLYFCTAEDGNGTVIYSHILGSDRLNELPLNLPDDLTFDTIRPHSAETGGGSGECRFYLEVTAGAETFLLEFDNFDYGTTGSILNFTCRGIASDTP